MEEDIIVVDENGSIHYEKETLDETIDKLTHKDEINDEEETSYSGTLKDEEFIIPQENSIDDMSYDLGITQEEVINAMNIQRAINITNSTNRREISK